MIGFLLEIIGHFEELFPNDRFSFGNYWSFGGVISKRKK
jgi:hypothetical protein